MAWNLLDDEVMLLHPFVFNPQKLPTVLLVRPELQSVGRTLQAARGPAVTSNGRDTGDMRNQNTTVLGRDGPSHPARHRALPLSGLWEALSLGRKPAFVLLWPVPQLQCPLP